MLRRQFLVTAAAAGMLAGCGVIGGAGDVTVQQILDYVKDKCNFLTDEKGIIDVIITVVTGFNAAAGAAATVAAAVAKQVQDMFCGAVDKQLAQNKTNRKAMASMGRMKVVVNGVTVDGQYVGK